ncbi:uncharacterized protein [Panulirus ornatus]|uniref:uncharacterized protein n=1 Tax=Panulirus ornatus TaxID=150431 RepID=UPI003A8A15C6
MKRRLLSVCVVTWAAAWGVLGQVFLQSAGPGLGLLGGKAQVGKGDLPALAQTIALQMPPHSYLPPPQPENATWRPYPRRPRRNNGQQQEPTSPPNDDPRQPPPPPPPSPPSPSPPQPPLSPRNGPNPPPPPPQGGSAPRQLPDQHAPPVPPSPQLPAQQYQPIAIPATCVCYPTATQVPQGFGSMMGYPFQPQPRGNYPGQNIALDSQSRSSAQANVETPTYVQVFKDDTMDPQSVTYV